MSTEGNYTTKITTVEKRELHLNYGLIRDLLIQHLGIDAEAGIEIFAGVPGDSGSDWTLEELDLTLCTTKITTVGDVEKQWDPEYQGLAMMAGVLSPKYKKDA